MNSISIIIPCFNDEISIKKKLNSLSRKLKQIKIKYEVIVINDGSSDDTLRELKSVGIKKNYIKIISNRKNFGKSYSIKKGLEVAKHEHIVLVDSDLPYFDTFEKIIKKLKQNYDFVFINRRHKNSRIINKKLNFYQISRIFIGWLVSLFVKLLLNFSLLGGDTQSGLKGFKKIKNFNKLNFVSTKFFLDLEIMYFYNKLNKRFYSIPVKYKIAENHNKNILLEKILKF